MNTFTIEIYNNNVFLEKLQKLQRQANKLNVYPPTVIGQQTKAVKRDGKLTICNIYTIEYEVIKLPNEYKLLAKKDHTEKLIYTVPNESLPEKYFTREPVCEYCQQNRDRKVTFFLSDKTNNIHQVGSTCLTKFLGIDVENVLQITEFYADLESELEENEELRSTGETVYDLTDILSIARYFQLNYGYVTNSQSDYGTQSTSNLVRDVLFVPENYKDIYQVIGENPQYKQDANSIIQYLLTLDTTDNVFFYNLRQIATNNYCTYKAISTACYAVVLYQKHLDKIESEKNKTTLDSKFVGNIKDKFTRKNPLVGTIYKISQPFASTYGYNTIYKRYYTILSNGNLFVWCTEEKDDITIGQEITLTGTIKDHKIDKYLNTETTILTNCRIM